MLAEAFPHVRKVYLAIGYTDYPRSIVIREELLRSTIDMDIFVNLLKYM